MYNFKERLGTRRTGLSVRLMSKMRIHQMRLQMVTGVFCAARHSRIRRWLHRKNDRPKRLVPDSLIDFVFFCQDVTDHCTLKGSADSPLFVCRDHSAPPLLGCKHDMGSLGFRWSVR